MNEKTESARAGLFYISQIFVNFLVTGDVEQFFMCLLVVCMSSLENHLYSGLPPIFLNQVILFCMSCSNILDIRLVSVISLASIFSPSVGCLFVLPVVALAVKAFKFN